MNDTRTLDLFAASVAPPRVEFVSPGEAERRKDRGAKKALESIDPEWRTRALAWIELLPLRARFTSDDLTAAVGMPPSHPSGVGAVILAASRLGLIRKAGYVPGRRASCNGAVVAEWVRVGGGE